MDEKRLEKLRSEIDQIDDQIIQLLRRRILVAREIGVAKGNDPVYDPEREKEVIQRLAEISPDIEGERLSAIYGEIMSLCRSVQSR